MSGEEKSEIPDIEPILEAIRRIHPGHRAKLDQHIEKLLTILDSYIASHPKMDNDELMEFAKLLEKIQDTSYYVYDELRRKTKYPSIYDKAVSMLRWSKINKKLGGKLPRMK